MPFNTPTLPEVRDTTQKDIFSRLSATYNTLRYTLLNVLSNVWSGLAYGLYGAIDFYSRQLFPSTAEGAYLDEQLQWRGITRLPAQTAIGSATFAGLEGTAVPIGLSLQSTAGLFYTTTTTATITGGFALVSVIANSPGIAYNIAATSVLQLAIPVLGIDSEATVGVDGISGGADVEGDDAYRLRGLQQIQSPNLYGQTGSYIVWAKESTQEITTAWEYVDYNNQSTLLVQVINGLVAVSAGGVTLANNYILNKAPVGVLWQVQTATPAPDNYTITITPDTSTNRTLALASINDWYSQNSKPGITVDITLVRNAIIEVPGIANAVINSPTADIPHALNQYPVVGTVIWS